MQERMFGNESVFGERPVNGKSHYVIRPALTSVFFMQFGAESSLVIPIPKHRVQLAAPDEKGYIHKSLHKFVSAVKGLPLQAALGRTKRIEI
jgi:hypothetical protein